MEGRSVDVLLCSRISQNGNRIIRIVAIVIPNDDFGTERCGAESRTEIVLYKIALLLGRHHKAGIVTAMLGFVLNCDRVDRYTFCLHLLQVFYKVVGVCTIVLWL